MKRRVVATSQFKKDARRILKRGWPEKALREVIVRLAEDEPLAASHRDHALTGPFSGFRECHVRPDWLLVYRKAWDELILTLTRTGTHADIFGL
jgi:mRNA interferase YafQ